MRMATLVFAYENSHYVCFKEKRCKRIAHLHILSIERNSNHYLGKMSPYILDLFSLKTLINGTFHQRKVTLPSALEMRKGVNENLDLHDDTEYLHYTT